MIFIEILPASTPLEKNVEPLIRQLNFDLILINSHLNQRPYSLSIKFEHE